jgi:outer membrane lipoprotein SlyB
MEEQKFFLELTGISPADAGSYARELREELLEAAKGVKAELKRDDAKAQDFGSTIVLILGAPSAVILARAVQDYLKRRRGVKLTIKNASGELMAENLTSEDAKSIVEILQHTE